MNFYTRGKMLYLDISIHNKRVRQSTGLTDSKANRAYCLKHKDLFLAQAKSKQNTPTQKSKKKLLSQVLQELLAQAKGLKLTTQESYKAAYNVIHRCLCGSKKDLKIHEISTTHIAGFYDFCLESNYSKGQISKLCQIMRRVLNYCVEKGYIQKSPFYNQRITTTPPKAEIKPFSLTEIQTILQNCDNVRFKTYLITAFFTGMRCGEIYALKWENVDFTNDEIHINATLSQQGLEQSPKTQSSKRIIDMLPIVKNALLAYKTIHTNDSYIFAENPKKNIRDDRQMWGKLLTKCGFEKRVLYNTRHTFASIMLSKGENPLWVGCKMLGHKDLSITFENYARYIEIKEKRAGFLDNFLQEKADSYVDCEPPKCSFFSKNPQDFQYFSLTQHKAQTTDPLPPSNLDQKKRSANV